jgi:hypothetical protein
MSLSTLATNPALFVSLRPTSPPVSSLSRPPISNPPPSWVHITSKPCLSRASSRACLLCINITMIRGFHKSHSSPASEPADVSRLLEPFYAAPPPPRYSSSHSNSYSSASSSSSPTTPAPTVAELQPRAYVDEHGHMHDPDFQLFPALPGRRRSSSYSDEDSEDDDAHTRFWKAQRRAAARRASSPFSPSSPPTSTPQRPVEPSNFYHRPSFEESVVWDEEPPYALRSTQFDAELEPEKAPAP